MGTCDDPVEATLPPITAPTASELSITADNYLTCKRKHAVVIIEKITAAEFFLRLILLRKHLRIPLFPFLRLNKRRRMISCQQDTQGRTSRHPGQGKQARQETQGRPGQDTQARQNKQDTLDT
jgi:hypothetical protein